MINKNRNERNSFNFTEFNTQQDQIERTNYFEVKQSTDGEKIMRKKSVGAVLGVKNQQVTTLKLG